MIRYFFNQKYRSQKPWLRKWGWDYTAKMHFSHKCEKWCEEDKEECLMIWLGELHKGCSLQANIRIEWKSTGENQVREKLEGESTRKKWIKPYYSIECWVNSRIHSLGSVNASLWIFIKESEEQAWNETRTWAGETSFS